MKRNAIDQIKTWFSQKNRKPLILRGARQVGKSTLVRMFAAENGIALHEINLERHLYLDKIFETLDLPRILAELEGLAGSLGNSAASLLFLDEIQATPHALPVLRYLYEDKPELAVIAAGSLLELTLSDHAFSMPVGRIEYLHLFPMSFGEYMDARDPALSDYLKSFSLNQTIPDSVHARLLRFQREYLFSGGMPEAVKILSEEGTMPDVTRALSNIVSTYIDDFAKYAQKGELARLQKVFGQIPLMIGQKVVYSRFSREDRSGEIKKALDLLSKARLCWKIHHSDCSGLPLAAGRDDAVYKLILSDTGLLSAMQGLKWNNVLDLDERSLVNEGPLAEQYIGQELIAGTTPLPDLSLVYWIREGRSGNAEVDYVIQSGSRIVPVEVKAGKSGSLKSLHQFVMAKKATLALRFDLNKPSLQEVSALATGPEGSVPQKFDLLSLPLYLSSETYRLIEELGKK